MLNRKVFPAIAAIVFICGLCTLAAQENAPKKMIALKAARVITAVDDTLMKNGVVIIAGERIKAVGAALPIPANAEVIDLGDATIMPGLIDAHTHLLSEMDGTNLALQDIDVLRWRFPGSGFRCAEATDDGSGGAVSTEPPL